MSAPSPSAPAPRRSSQRVDPGQLAQAVAAAVRAHPAVADLDGGPFGAIASYLPGRRVLGVRIGEARIGEPPGPVEISVVARLGTPLPQLATELRDVITTVIGSRPVEVTINDVITDAPTLPTPAP